MGRSAEDDEEEEVVHMGNAIMSFYSALIDLLGRCAPEMHVSLADGPTPITDHMYSNLL